MRLARPRRHIATALSDTNNTKITDATPSGNPELQRTTTLPTPAADEHIRIKRIRGAVGVDGTINSPEVDPPYSGALHGYLDAKIVGFDASPVRVASSFNSVTDSPSDVITECTNDALVSGTRTVNGHVGALGANVTVELYLEVDKNPLSVANAVCLNNIVIEYDLVKRVYHGRL